MRKLLTLTMAVALLLMSIPAASAGPNARPFKASMEGSVFFVGDPACTNNPWSLRTDSAATGRVSHLGRTTMTARHCTPGGTSVEGGEMTLVAANGDQMFIEYEAFAPPPNENGIVVVEGDFEIVGGDGRFEEAHGGGDLYVLVVFEGFGDPEWAASWKLHGTIGY